MGPVVLGLAWTKFTSSYTHALTILYRVYATMITSIFAEIAVSGNFCQSEFCGYRLDSDHPSQVNEAHYSSLSHFEGVK